MTPISTSPRWTATLTAAGRAKVEAAAPPHVEAVRRHLIDILTPMNSPLSSPGVPEIADRAQRALTVRETRPDETIECEAVVVGSGSGGGVAATEVAKAGKRVLVLEAGSYYAESEFRLTDVAGDRGPSMPMR